MDGEMEEQDTIAIWFAPNWRFALVHTSEAMGQLHVVTQSCEFVMLKHRRALISVSLGVLKPNVVLLSSKSPKVFIRFSISKATHVNQLDIRIFIHCSFGPYECFFFATSPQFIYIYSFLWAWRQSNIRKLITRSTYRERSSSSLFKKGNLYNI